MRLPAERVGSVAKERRALGARVAMTIGGRSPLEGDEMPTFTPLDDVQPLELVAGHGNVKLTSLEVRDLQSFWSG